LILKAKVTNLENRQRADIRDAVGNRARSEEVGFKQWRIQMEVDNALSRAMRTDGEIVERIIEELIE
jgi:hypothetical protein